MWEITKEFETAALLKYHIWQTEQATRLLGRQTACGSYPHPVTTFSVVMDARNWRPTLATAEAL
jgi:hypothetical protein